MIEDINEFVTRMEATPSTGKFGGYCYCECLCTYQTTTYTTNQMNMTGWYMIT